MPHSRTKRETPEKWKRERNDYKFQKNRKPFLKFPRKHDFYVFKTVYLITLVPYTTLLDILPLSNPIQDVIKTADSNLSLQFDTIPQT